MSGRLGQGTDNVAGPCQHAGGFGHVSSRERRTDAEQARLQGINILRKAAVTASSAVLLTAVGAVSGIGLSAAQALDVTASPGVVVVNLTAAETTQVVNSPDVAYSKCTIAFATASSDSFIRPPIEFNCEAVLMECSRLAAGRPLAVVFYWSSTECRF
ncbi:MAG TPA: hypothetical protein VH085_02630 [Nocardioides sp.]|jgi:hypothetical protein|nr:hypothetical protein [Nocardioides sp.]